MATGSPSWQARRSRATALARSAKWSPGSGAAGGSSKASIASGLSKPRRCNTATRGAGSPKRLEVGDGCADGGGRLPASPWPSSWVGAVALGWRWAGFAGLLSTGPRPLSGAGLGSGPGSEPFARLPLAVEPFARWPLACCFGVVGSVGSWTLGLGRSGAGSCQRGSVGNGAKGAIRQESILRGLGRSAHGLDPAVVSSAPWAFRRSSMASLL
jgi:hypothetical protein